MFRTSSASLTEPWERCRINGMPLQDTRIRSSRDTEWEAQAGTCNIKYGNISNCFCCAYVTLEVGRPLHQTFRVPTYFFGSLLFSCSLPCFALLSCSSTWLWMCPLSRNSFIWAIFPLESNRTKSTNSKMYGRPDIDLWIRRSSRGMQS